MTNAEQNFNDAAQFPTPRFFGIGWCKTGSNSLTKAMTMLGFRALHLGAFTATQPESDYHTRLWNTFNDTTLNPLTNVARFVAEFDFVVDWPIHLMWHRLYTQNPDAKFIVTYRDPHEIAFSCRRHDWRLVRRGKARNFLETYAELSDIIVQHYSQIFEAALVEPNRFLTISLADTDEYRWRALCGFTETATSKILTDGKFPPWPKEYVHADHSFVQ